MIVIVVVKLNICCDLKEKKVYICVHCTVWLDFIILKDFYIFCPTKYLYLNKCILKHSFFAFLQQLHLLKNLAVIVKISLKIPIFK